MFPGAGRIAKRRKSEFVASRVVLVMTMTVIAQTSAPAAAQATASAPPSTTSQSTSLSPSPPPSAEVPAESKPWDPKEQLLGLLPPVVSDGLDISGWAWFSYLHNDQSDNNFTDTLFSLSVTKSFAQRVAVSVEANYMNADGHWRAELEQLYVSIMACPDTQTLITVGKFNANFGIEARDFWNRTHGTTSLLFGAQPQDIVGAMLAQPIGDTGVTLRPFVSLDFQGQPEVNQPPSGGLQVEYKPSPELRFSWTNWAGPGFVLEGGRPLRHPYPQGSYGSGNEYGGDDDDEDEGESINANAIENWQGPNLYAQRAGTLYFTDANITWHPRDDLTLGTEFLLGTTGTDLGRWGWSGVMLTADFDVTDRLALFARYSYLDDADWLIYGRFEDLYEISAGAGYKITKNLEVRGEYRHDNGSQSGNSDSVSLHVTVGF